MNPLTPYPITPIFSLLGFVLAISPLPWQLRRWDTGVFMYGTWIAVMNAQGCVNTIIWHDNVQIITPVWCDIVTRLQVGAPPALRACTLATSIYLFKVARFRASGSVIKSRRRDIFVNLFLTLGLPAVIMGLYIIVQAFRFSIFEEIGCRPVAYSFVSYIILAAPQVILTVASACLTIFNVRSLNVHRGEGNKLLSNSQPLSRSHYKRLLIMTSLDTLFNLPILILSLSHSLLMGKNNPWNLAYENWPNVHEGVVNFTFILQVPATLWATSTWNILLIKMAEWIYVCQALIFFLVFAPFSSASHQRRYEVIHAEDGSVVSSIGSGAETFRFDGFEETSTPTTGSEDSLQLQQQEMSTVYGVESSSTNDRSRNLKSSSEYLLEPQDDSDIIIIGPRTSGMTISTRVTTGSSIRRQGTLGKSDIPSVPSIPFLSAAEEGDEPTTADTPVMLDCTRAAPPGSRWSRIPRTRRNVDSIYRSGRPGAVVVATPVSRSTTLASVAEVIVHEDAGVRLASNLPPRKHRVAMEIPPPYQTYA